jgi:hypothetical protein
MSEPGFGGIFEIKGINSQRLFVYVPMWLTVLAVHPTNHSNPPKSRFRQKM